MDAAVYNRVSTAQQLDNFSLDEQSRVNREYAHRNGMRVVKEVTVDESASDLFRAGLDELLQLMEARTVQALVVYASDRLSRSTVDGLLLLEALAKSNVELHYSSRGKVENTPEQRILHAVEFSMNEYWKFKLTQALHRGRQGKLNEGRYLGIGVTPYGYKKISSKRDAQIEPFEEEASVVRQIFEWYVIEDWGMHQICRELDARGIPTYTQKYRSTENRKFSGWTEAVVRTILIKELYTGVATFNGMKTEEFYDHEQKKHRLKVTRGTGKEVRVPVPAIIDREIWERAQQKLAQKRSRRVESKGPREFLLRTSLECGLCQHAISTKVIKPRKQYSLYHYYRCSNEDSYKGPQCPLPSFRADIVDPIAWHYICDLLMHPERIEEGLRRSQSGTTEANDKIRKLIAETEALTAKQEEALRNILKLRIESSNAVTNAHLVRMQEEVEKLLEDLAQRRENLQASLIPEMDIESTVSALQEFNRQIDRGLLTMEGNFETRRQLAVYLQVRGILTVEDGEKVMYLGCVLDPTGKKYRVTAETFSLTHGDY